jgi:hypothetical protein
MSFVLLSKILNRRSRIPKVSESKIMKEKKGKREG